MTKRVHFITLGCKVNQYETQAMRESLERIGIIAAKRSKGRTSLTAREKGSVDFVVINTCTVTETADRENLYWIRRARRECPSAKIVVTGCFTSKNRKEIEALQDVDLILDHHEKADIAARLMAGCCDEGLQTRSTTAMASKTSGFSLPVSRSDGKTRAFVKIQDGCNHGCSFCKVVLIRGRSRSRALVEIIEEAKRLRDSGYQEIVLTGIQLGAYGDELKPKKDLTDVIESCAQIEGIDRIRLSAIEPTDIKPPLVAALRDIEKCCPYLHIPLQSGDDEILKRMNRRYSRSFYMDLVARLKSEIADFSLTLDVMAGFPGEEETHFQNTVQVLKTVKPLKCHVFPYSRREGTRAASFSDLSKSLIRQRTQELLILSHILGREVSQAYLGRVMDVLVENQNNRSKLMQGLTKNYLKVVFPGEGRHFLLDNIARVRIISFQDQVFSGKVEVPLQTRASTEAG